MAEHLNINRNYKDRLFRFIFNDPKDLLSLYNAINATDYSNPDDISINTIGDYIYMSMKNDVSFLIHDILNLYEHQSTWAPNMPYRELIYLVDLLKGYVEMNHLDIYGSRQLYLPTPFAIVFYNGKDDIPERSYLYLSDSFVNKKELSSLEFKTLVLNINHGKNKDLMGKCRRLRDYSFFVAKVRELAAGVGDLKESINQAIDICIQENVLSDILSKHRAEVTTMLLSEYDEAAHIANEKRWSFEDGEQRGIIIGEIKAYKKMGVSRQETRDMISSGTRLEDSVIDDLMKTYWPV